MKSLLLCLLVFPMIIIAQGSDDNQEKELIELNKYLFTEYSLNKNTVPLSETATDDFLLIAAPGMIENKAQAIKGVVNLDIVSLNVDVDRVLMTEDVGIVIGVLEMKGTIMKRPVPGKIRYSSTFVRQDGKWRLKMRTMTPMRM